MLKLDERRLPVADEACQRGVSLCVADVPHGEILNYIYVSVTRAGQEVESRRWTYFIVCLATKCCIGEGGPSFSTGFQCYFHALRWKTSVPLGNLFLSVESEENP